MKVFFFNYLCWLLAPADSITALEYFITLERFLGISLSRILLINWSVVTGLPQHFLVKQLFQLTKGFCWHQLYYQKRICEILKILAITDANYWKVINKITWYVFARGFWNLVKGIEKDFLKSIENFFEPSLQSLTAPILKYS